MIHLDFKSVCVIEGGKEGGVQSSSRHYQMFLFHKSNMPFNMEWKNGRVQNLTLPAGISQKTIFSNKLCIETKGLFFLFSLRRGTPLKIFKIVHSTQTY